MVCYYGLSAGERPLPKASLFILFWLSYMLLDPLPYLFLPLTHAPSFLIYKRKNFEIATLLLPLSYPHSSILQPHCPVSSV